MEHRAMDYQPKQQVLIIVKDPDKLAPQNQGPFCIEAVHDNGMVTIECALNVFKCINIHHMIQPYWP